MDKTKKTKTITRRNNDKRNNKRWSDEEIKQLLQYLKEQPEIEKPTAQIFYRKFLETCNIEASWSLCRWKIKNLKTNYKKAETWRRSNGYVETEPNVKETLNKICRFYDDLHVVFGNTFENFSYDTLDSSNMANFNQTYANESPMEESIDEYLSSAIKTEDNEALLVALRSTTTSPALSTPAEIPNEESNLNCEKTLEQEFSAKLLKTSAVNPAYHQVSNMPESATSSYLKMKLDFEKEKFQKEFELKERKFAAEIEERKENFELKKLQMQKDERLRVLELEMRERIEKFEIEMKYGCKRKV